ncbi:DUF6157 family protein [Chryseobacterium sp.]|uniref:DUF6157 family protein n=1 Tax=Chryseobacterium sp. TaxID=1871047 RepID=UPI0011CCD6FA|nr:DUF6157 family protein [Chryseobacterium sp.]TXF79319.1 hypothetical protein FUA25_02725 [Chryseobacterium sp.]
MKTHTTNYKDTFIEIAEDCPVSESEIPPMKRNRTLAEIQYDMISKNPYRFSSDDVMFECYVQKNDITETEKTEARKQFFSKGQACFRSSALGKRYGFGVHSNSDGKVALYPVESEEYQKFVEDPEVKKVKAMRTKKG